MRERAYRQAAAGMLMTTMDI
jgi:hypothetical protein